MENRDKGLGLKEIIIIEDQHNLGAQLLWMEINNY